MVAANIIIDTGVIINKIRIFVVGIDGGSFRILDQHLNFEGSNYSKIKNRSASGILNSTFPPITGPAWTSFKSGMKPIHTGIFDWGTLNSNYSRSFISSYSNPYPDYWEYLENFNKRSVIYNVPITYPPKPLKDSVLISGMFTPGKRSGFSSRSGIKESIIKNVPEFFIDIVKSKYQSEPKDIFINALNKMLNMRVKTFNYLLNNFEYDNAMVVFTAFDRIQHCLLDYIDKDHPNYSTAKANLIRESLNNLFKNFDNYLGDLLKRLNKDDYLIFVSDHGFGYNAGRFFINRWLADNGYLTIKKKRRALGFLYRIAFSLGLTKEKLTRFAGKLGIKKSESKVSRLTRSSSMVNWMETTAYANSTEGLQVNLKGRESSGIVEPGSNYEELIETLISELRAIIAPDGKKLFNWVRSGKDYFDSNADFRFPDILYSIDDDRYVVDPSHEKRELFSTETVWDSGYHRKEGMFMVYGKGIKPGVTQHALNIYDIYPLICYLNNVDIPKNLDGKFPRILFQNDYLNENAPVFGLDIEKFKVTNNKTNSEIDEDEIAKRLKGMGYL